MSPEIPKLNWRDVAAASVLSALWFFLVRPGGFDLPFFWDEADVYVPGSRWVAENGLSITPGVFPDDYSRGHPPLLYLLAGTAFLLFGATPAVAHLLMLPFGVLALVATYALGAELFGRRSGAAAALLLACTPLFMTMGNMLLPEMPLTALAVASLLAFARGRIGLAALAGCAAVLIKETGIFSAGAVGVALLYDAYLGGALRSRESAKRIAWATTPLLALVLFFVWQRANAGYFIFPHHQGLFTDRPMGWDNVLTVVPSLFLWHGRWLITLSGVLALGALWKRRRKEQEAESWKPQRRSVLLAASLLVAFNWVFFAKMFWLERYALPAHPGLLVLFVGALFALVGKSAPKALVVTGLVSISALWGLYALYGPAPRDAEEHTYAYADVIDSHREAIASLEGPRFVVTTWPLSVELRYPYLGYVSEEIASTEFQYLDARDHERVTHVIVNTASRQAPELEAFAEAQGLEEQGAFQVDDAPRLVVYARPEG